MHLGTRHCHKRVKQVPPHYMSSRMRKGFLMVDLDEDEKTVEATGRIWNIVSVDDANIWVSRTNCTTCGVEQVTPANVAYNEETVYCMQCIFEYNPHCSNRTSEGAPPCTIGSPCMDCINEYTRNS